MSSNKIISSCVFWYKMAFLSPDIIISVFSVDFPEQELLPFQNIQKTEGTFNFLHGTDAILTVLCEYPEWGEIIFYLYYRPLTYLIFP